MPTLPISIAVDGDTYTVPGADTIEPLAASVAFDGSGAAGAFVPCLAFYDQSGRLVSRTYPASGGAATAVAAGGSAEVSFIPFGGADSGGQTNALPRNLGELGFTGSGTLGSTYAHTVAFEDVPAGDGILVSAQAPGVPSLGQPEGFAISCTDSQGNTYIQVAEGQWEANPPNVNEGVHQVFFFCQSSIRPLRAGVDTITVTWINPVYDRSIYAWIVRHAGGAAEPSRLDQTDSFDTAVYLSPQVTLTSPEYITTRDNALLFATLLSAKAGGIGSFGAVAGYDGFFQAQFRDFTGSKQTYLFNVQTHGANVYLSLGDGLPQYEIDLGLLLAGEDIPTFNGVGQTYSAGANAWKGIVLFALD